MATHLRALLRMAPATAVAVFSLGFVAATPAWAADDGQENFFSAVFGLITTDVGVDNTPPPIDYRERAPLVLPPKMELRKPIPPVAERTKAWPQDPEIVAAKKAAALAKAPRVGDQDKPMTAEEMHRRGPVDPNAGVPSGDCLDHHTCDPTAFWAMLKNTKKVDTTQVQLTPGQEPPREYLTQPPPGYLAPTKVVKFTGAAPKPNVEDDPNDNSAHYFRQQKDSQYSPDTP